MKIALLHKYYNENHLATVKNEMIALGAPEIKCIWSDMYEMWLAVEGCHRLRAAHQMGITPVIINVTDDDTVIMQVDETDEEVSVTELAEELNDAAWKATILDF